MSKFCRNCGAVSEGREALCGQCGSPAVVSGTTPVPREERAEIPWHRYRLFLPDKFTPPQHLPPQFVDANTARAAALRGDKKVRIALLTLLGALLVAGVSGIVAILATNETSNVPTGPVVIIHGPDYDKRAIRHDSTGSPQSATTVDRPPVSRQAVDSSAIQLPKSEDGELRDDGRIYSVALIVETTDIPVGEKLFAQGRVVTFGYASGLRSRPFAVIADEQQPDEDLFCGMMEDEGATASSLYHAQEIVAVSGTYMGVASVSGYPAMPIIRDCHMADRQDHVVRPSTSASDRK